MVRIAQRNRKRQGVILLIVMAMIALFASVGVTFVFYADSEANIARTARQSEGLWAPDAEAELLLNHFLAQLLYDGPEYSALRGHSLGRTMYGEDPSKSGKNGIPFNGGGMLGYTHTAAAIAGIDNRMLLNYMRHDSDNFVRDPEYYGTRAPGGPLGKFVGGANVPWTYPGRSNAFLAAVNAAGEVILPSYYRPWTGGDPLNPAFANDVAPSPTASSAKYKTFRPHKSYHPAFENPLFGTEGPDVRNLPFGPGMKKPGGGYYANDSFWMYTGYPVLTSPSGKKYTVLFAPLIIDLDNRVNLMIHGNVRGAGGTHASHQGWGRWEVNPARICDANEFWNFLKGPGRYGDGKPDDHTLPLPLLGLPTPPYPPVAQLPPYYSLFNFDSVATGRMSLPAAGSMRIFPSFAAGWDNGDATEVADHPAKFNYQLPAGNDRPRLHPSHMEALLRGLGKGSPALTSDLFKYMPKTMSDPARRNLLTILSHDVDRPGLLPYLTSTATYTYDLVQKRPVAAPLPFPDPATTPVPGGDFDGALMRSRLGSINRLNLNRTLVDYPAPFVDPIDPTTLQIADAAGFAAAQTQRQKMAKDLYDYLILVTGAQDPNTGKVASPSDEYRAARWLAQLAVNIVDYIDNDDYMTPFQWDGTEYIYGTELPRLVINEAYAQYDIDPEDPGFDNGGAAPNASRLSCWVELYNPFEPTPAGFSYPRESGAARLANGKEAVYRLILSRADAALRSPDNATGNPDPKRIFQANRGGGDCIVADWTAGTVVAPGGGTFDQGFFVVGPDQTPGKGKAKGKGKGLGKGGFIDGFNPGFATSQTSSFLAAEVALADAGTQPTILLQRLACPHLPHHAVNNPYLTVDYVENVAPNVFLDFNNPPNLALAKSVGRRQPYHGSLLVDQNPSTPVGGQPKHTFFQQNCKEDKATYTTTGINYTGNTLDTFDWLTHLDRQLINPMELLHVSGYRPHELTQQFVTGGIKFKHRAPWFEKNALIHRLFELVQTPDHMAGTAAGGRVPGKININTVWDVETFRAICDAHPTLSGFSDVEVAQIWQALVAQRTPGGIPGNNDKPFYPLSAGYTPATPNGHYFHDLDVNHTLLREDPADTSRRLLGVPGKTHPYEQMEVLTKIFGNLTMRSNTFAVWVTVGFFEVTDDTVSPPRLGQEIGKSDNRHIRHKMFAIVDRTQMQVRPMQPNGTDMKITLASDHNPPPGGFSKVTFTFNPPRTDLTFDTMSGAKWTIDVGTPLIVGPDLPNEEAAVVSAVDPPNGTFELLINKAHKAGEEIICRSWHAPWLNYDVRRDSKVVPYFTTVD